LDNGDIITGCTEFRYLGFVLNKTEDTQKYTPQGNTSTENNRCIQRVWWSKDVTKKQTKRSIRAWLKVSSSTEPKLGVYVRITGE